MLSTAVAARYFSNMKKRLLDTAFRYTIVFGSKLANWFFNLSCCEVINGTILWRIYIGHNQSTKKTLTSNSNVFYEFRYQFLDRKKNYIYMYRAQKIDGDNFQVYHLLR